MNTSFYTAASTRALCVLCGDKIHIEVKDKTDTDFSIKSSNLQYYIEILEKHGIYGCEKCGEAEVFICALPLTFWKKVTLWFKRTLGRNTK